MKKLFLTLIGLSLLLSQVEAQGRKGRGGIRPKQSRPPAAQQSEEAEPAPADVDQLLRTDLQRQTQVQRELDSTFRGAQQRVTQLEKSLDDQVAQLKVQFGEEVENANKPLTKNFEKLAKRLSLTDQPLGAQLAKLDKNELSKAVSELGEDHPLKELAHFLQWLVDEFSEEERQLMTSFEFRDLHLYWLISEKKQRRELFRMLRDIRQLLAMRLVRGMAEDRSRQAMVIRARLEQQIQEREATARRLEELVNEINGLEVTINAELKGLEDFFQEPQDLSSITGLIDRCKRLQEQFRRFIIYNGCLQPLDPLQADANENKINEYVGRICHIIDVPHTQIETINKQRFFIQNNNREIHRIQANIKIIWDAALRKGWSENDRLAVNRLIDDFSELMHSLSSAITAQALCILEYTVANRGALIGDWAEVEAYDGFRLWADEWMKELVRLLQAAVQESLEQPMTTLSIAQGATTAGEGALPPGYNESPRPPSGSDQSPM